VKHKAMASLVLGVGIVLATAPPALAQDQDAGYRLLLADALRTALSNNLDLVSARKDPAIAAQRIEANKAPFDGVISTGAEFNRNEGDDTITENITGISGPAESDTDVLTGDVSFSHLLNYGGSYALTYNLVDVDASGTSIQPSTGFLTSSIFEQQTGGFTLSYDMPLLNGFGKEVNTVDILLARGNLEMSNEDLRLAAIDTLQAVEDAYWNVVAAREAIRISRLALERAEDLLALNRKKVEVGTLAPIEITEAEAGVASQVEAVIVSETTLEDAEDVLLQLMAVPPGSPTWEQSLDLPDRPSFEHVEVDLEGAIATAFESRPELAAARQKLRNDELSERVAKKRSGHGLDLTAAVTPNQTEDVDRVVQILLPPDIPGSDTTTESDSTDWRVGLRYTYTLHNRAQKANYAMARLNADKSELALQNTEQAIRIEVRRAARNLDSDHQRIEAAQTNLRLQTEKLDAEQRKFENGMSTSFEVLTFQNDLADAELGLVRAALDYAKAATALEKAKGTLLEARGMSLGE